MSFGNNVCYHERLTKTIGFYAGKPENMTQTHTADSYYITLKTAIAGLFYRKLDADPHDKFTSFYEIAEYLEDLAQEIRSGGDTCYVISDRYRNEHVFSDVSDIMVEENDGFRLRAGRDIEDVVDKFYGAIPIPVITYMESLDEKYNARQLEENQRGLWGVLSNIRKQHPKAFALFS